MTFRVPPGEPLPELTTTRLGGGRSARLVAVGVAVVLCVAVYVGISGQNKAAPGNAAPTPRPVAVAATPTPAPSEPSTPSESTAPPTTGPTGTYPGATAFDSDGVPSNSLAVSLIVDGKRAIASLNEWIPRQFHAGFVVPVPLPASKTPVVQLIDINPSSPPGRSYGVWELAAGEFNFGGAADVLVDVLLQPQPHDANATQLVRNGYRFIATIEPASSFAVLNIDVMVGADPTFPDERYDVVALAGDVAYKADMDTSLPGVVQGSIVFDDRLKSKTVSIQLTATPASDGDPVTFVVKDYQMEVPRTKHDSRYLDDRVGPDISGTAEVGIVANGYYWQASFLVVSDRRVLLFTLEINATVDPVLFPAPPLVVGDIAGHGWVSGDDGLVGWPTALAPTSGE